MRDWDTRISELKKNIEAARNRFVIPFLDSKYLEAQVVKDVKSKPTVNEKSETKEFDKNEFPLLISVIDSICNNKKLEINW